jgi:hypothetical protein
MYSLRVAAAGLKEQAPAGSAPAVELKFDAAVLRARRRPTGGGSDCWARSESDSDSKHSARPGESVDHMPVIPSIHIKLIGF